MAKNYVEKFHLPALIDRAAQYFKGGRTVSAEAGRAYMREIVERAKACDVFPFPCGEASAFRDALLCGARNWSQASAGGCFLVDAVEISARAGIDFTECDGGEEIKWQAAALRAAASALISAYQDMRAKRRQFYVTHTLERKRREGGAVYSFVVYEHLAEPRRTPTLMPVAGGRYCTAAFRGERHEAWLALCGAGVVPAFKHCGKSDYFPENELGESSPLGAYCTIEQLN